MAPLYARYIPPKKAAGTASSEDIQSKVSTTATQTRKSAPVPKEKRKRDQPIKSVQGNDGPSIHPDRAAQLVPAIRHASHSTENALSEPQDDQGYSSIKRRRVERSGKASSPSHDPDLDDEAARILQKHGGILSKFQRSIKKNQDLLNRDATASVADQSSPRPLHDLVPIPAPEREVSPEYRQTFSTLPSWISKPFKVSTSVRKDFKDLDVPPETVQRLAKAGFERAFAVQCELIPRLLSRVRDPCAPVNDICVSAPTGSGKTLAYSLPIVMSLQHHPHTTKLRALIVVPTRELCQQVSDMLAKLTNMRVGVSVGHQNFEDEQRDLVETDYEFHPEEYERLMSLIKKHQTFDLDCFDSSDDCIDNNLSEGRNEQYFEHCLKAPPFSVPAYKSRVGILVCTPGRLVEHLIHTPGFNLRHLEWLVIDEADQLLNQSFQEWVEVINAAITHPTSPNDVPDFDRIGSGYSQPYVRKVVLSATMTKDVTQLNALDLRRPSLLTVQGEGADLDHVTTKDNSAEEGNGDFALPPGLAELVVPVGDGDQKPLFLIELLDQLAEPQLATSKSPASLLQSQASSGSDSETSSSSENSTSDSDTDSSSDFEPMEPLRSSVTLPLEGKDQSQSVPTKAPRVLIFASSNSEAHRLLHLLKTLSPLFDCRVLTRGSKVPRSLSTSSIRTQVLISTDLASRGLDLPLTHVINYTVPRSVEAYVHRIGRTARAGRQGTAYSLVADKEAAWFWNEIARNRKVRREVKVERRRVVLGKKWTDGSHRAQYDRVLAEMSQMVDDEEISKSRKKEKKKKG